jgi:hypothetical protein
VAPRVGEGLNVGTGLGRPRQICGQTTAPAAQKREG